MQIPYQFAREVTGLLTRWDERDGQELTLHKIIAHLWELAKAHDGRAQQCITCHKKLARYCRPCTNNLQWRQIL